MDLILPTNQNTSAPVTLDTKVLVVIGANGQKLTPTLRRAKRMDIRNAFPLP